MCGIAGLIKYKGDAGENIHRMNERMLHRGPDDGGIFVSDDGNVALGHRRLSIVDLSKNGAQPFVSASGKTVMVYNGEIYNNKEIKDRLVREGKVSTFRSTSDTEVLIEAIEAYGIKEALTMSKGMFALAVYDKEKNTITLARDRVGEKPLYYGKVAGAFGFASDIGCLRVVEGFDNKINTGVLDIYFTEGYIPAPYSVYEGINKLEAGCILELDVNTLEYKTYPYWSMYEAARKGQENPFTGSRKEAADELERLLKASIKDQMVADVPVGAFLSAGIDSSTIVSLMQDLAPGKVRTFTIGMEQKEYNEAVYAKEIAAHLGTDHTELYITENDAKAVVPKLASMFGEPFADSSQIPTFLVSKMTRDHVTVSLSGDAGDELFCGYTSYNSVSRIWGKMKNIPYFIRKPASALVLHSPLAKKDIYRIKGTLLGAKGPGDIHRLEHETDPLTKKIALSQTVLPYKYTELEKIPMDEVNHQCMLMDMLVYHPDDILVKVDRTAMAVSLETRVPMLDRDLVEFAWRLPIDYLSDGQTGKLVLRDVLYKYVPREMMERPKKGFAIPIDTWLKDKGLREWAENLIEENKLKAQGILDPAVVKRMWEDFTQKGIYRIEIWYILMFQQWYENEYIGNVE
ncbi:asparagine synthase (glutamine-hydrolyzing) [Butyrivibrio sp. DSM 10294]|uniref:asparagine synthase (glutamine-hydrolyzing) n=1 Tax=Butyrivibrio sp. DSM 10294 TaxID=2972457 RepID=UPI00234E6960|nr:asparagine synthase (glutamine-hydrolyzing) [Butyrivibrio sp. DSM 10294]MDC7292978.1 asparagine synthase (glutamine-hydrolyzing) [Butyrivibrio sp. DSM 10294]